MPQLLIAIEKRRMKKSSLTCLDKIIILCRNIEKTSCIYCETLGLKMLLQSPHLVELSDSNSLRIYLKATNKPAHLSKGYTPILSFRVEYFDEVREKMLRYELIQDGEVVESRRGKIVSFLGNEGEHISINNFKEEEEDQEGRLEEESKSEQEIRNILSKIKL